MGSLPLPELSDEQHELLRLSFHHLLEAGTTASPGYLSESSGLSVLTVAAELAELARAGRLRLSDQDAVAGALGLTIEPTAHRLEFGQAVRYTWCALDALGIMGALVASGRISSTSPYSGNPMEIAVTDGEPQVETPGWVLFLAVYEACSPVVDRWCPLVNFFESEAAAKAWADQAAVSGECVPLVAAAENATTLWRSRLAPRRSPASPQVQGGRAATRTARPASEWD